MAEIEIIGGLEEHYTMIPNDIFRDKTISPRAVKIYGFLRSHTTGWRINVRGLATQMGIGKNSVNSSLNELQELGYMSREWVTDSNGLRTGIKYKVFHSRCPRNEDTGVPLLGNPAVGNPETGTHKEDQSFKKTNLKENHPPIAPQGADEMARFQEFWDAYDHKKNRGGAEKAWKKALKSADAQELIGAAKLFIETQRAIGKHPQYTPYPSTWLNGKRWLDDVDTPEELGGFGYDINFDD